MVSSLTQIEELDHELEDSFQARLHVETSLSRMMVSFQANKNEPSYRWYKYKEAFSAALVNYLIERFAIHSGSILDPFAGSGTAIFAASQQGLNADGIELLPIGQQIMRARVLLQSECSQADID